DSYEYDESTQRLTGQRNGRSFALGDQVKVRIDNVSVPRRQIDLGLVEHTALAPPPLTPVRKKQARDERKQPVRPAPSRRKGNNRSERGSDRGRSNGRPGKKRRR